MKYFPLIVFIVSLVVVIPLVAPNLLGILFVAAPIFIPMFSELLNLSGRIQSRALPRAGVVVCILALPIYASFYYQLPGSSTDALILGVVPFVQLAVLVIVAVICTFVNLLGGRNSVAQ